MPLSGEEEMFNEGHMTGFKESEAEIKRLRAALSSLEAERDEWKVRAEKQFETTQLVTKQWQIEVKAAEAKLSVMREAFDRLLIAGNHIANYRTELWPDYKLNGITQDQLCESALRTLGAGMDYDMWCCWSAMMRVRDDLTDPALSSLPVAES